MSQNERVVRSFFNDVLGKGDIAKLEDLLHPDYKPQKFSVKKWERLALKLQRDDTCSGLVSVIRAFHDTMEQIDFDIRSIVEDENKIAVFWSVKGKGYLTKNRDELINMKWETDGAHFFEFKDNMIYRLTYVADSLSAYIQGKMAMINENELDKMKTYIYALEGLGLFK